MNDFASIENSGILKNVYNPDTASNSMKEALLKRKQKLIAQGSVPADSTYNSIDLKPNINS